MVESPLMWKQVIALLTIAISLSACARDRYSARDRYTVVGRTNDSDSKDQWNVKVVLEHDGHKLYAKCGEKATVEGCTFHVGQTLDCKFLPRHQEFLTCGNGKSDTIAGNDVLLIEKEEQ
jgi:hypothetical protein